MATNADVKSLLHFDGGDQRYVTDYGHAPKGWVFRGEAVTHTTVGGAGGVGGNSLNNPSAALLGIGGLGPAWIESQSTDFAVPSGLFSIELRVWFSSFYADIPQDVFGQANSVGGNLGFRLHKNAASQLIFSCPGLPTLTFAGASTNTWAVISIEGDGTTLRAFKNGVLMASDAYTGPIGTSTSKFALGRCGEYAGYPMAGGIDEFRFTEGGVWHTATHAFDTVEFSNPTTGHTAAATTGSPVTNFGTAHAVFSYGSTPVVVLQDDFRGSGALAGSSATVKFSDLSSWVVSPVGLPASRSSSGLSANASGWGEVGCHVTSTTSVRGPGVFVAQAKGLGPTGCIVFFGSDRYAGVRALGTGILVAAEHPSTAGRYDIFGTDTHGWADATTLRLEFDLTNVRAYADNVLLSTDPFPLTATDIVTQIGVFSGPMPSGPTVFSKYISVATNTTSGPLGDLELPQYFAASIGEVTRFGTPALPGHVTGEAPLTGFGTPSGFLLNYATTIGFVTNFGTAVQTPNKSLAAESLAPATTFGEVESVRDPMPAPIGRVTWLAPQTAFGVPAADGQITSTAAGIAPGEFSTPKALLKLGASGSTSGAFGVPIIGTVARANGARGTNFGVPTTLRPFTTAGVNRTTFGTPRVDSGRFTATTGWLATSFGTPSAISAAQRTRSGVFRTRFGRAQAERFAA